MTRHLPKAPLPSPQFLEPDEREENWRALAAAVVLQAARDAVGSDACRALDACLWLCDGTELSLYTEREDCVELLTSGRLLRMRGRLASC